ncbi:TPA: hypothetical protein I8273_004587 [Aeromonas hydrophila]|nr:hypothetical protein [Aeromonas hydrophila]HAT2639049.1 hypothetical protein [Aeromonas hydrophila]HAT3424302.1 hypothetical protein [Aeromonas hydrophila]HAT3534280.1 hypothetical protein [Aeromonas hydrophila]
MDTKGWRKNEGKGGRMILAVGVSTALLLGCAGGGAQHYEIGSSGYSRQYDRLADSVTLANARAVSSAPNSLSVTMLTYEQSVSEQDFAYLTNAYAPLRLEDLLDSICAQNVGVTPPVAKVPTASFSVDGVQVGMSLAGQLGWVFGVNQDYCTGGELKAVFMASKQIAGVPWLVESKRSIHMMKNGTFEFETMPGFAMVTTPGQQGHYTSGLFVVKGHHRIEAPVNVSRLSSSVELDAVYSPTFFINPALE